MEKRGSTTDRGAEILDVMVTIVPGGPGDDGARTFYGCALGPSTARKGVAILQRHGIGDGCSKLGDNEGMSSNYTYQVVFERDSDGGYAVMCPAIAGCISQGDSIEQATENIRDAILLSIADMRQRGEAIPAPTEVTTGSVAIAV